MPSPYKCSAHSSVATTTFIHSTHSSLLHPSTLCLLLCIPPPFSRSSAPPPAAVSTAPTVVPPVHPGEVVVVVFVAVAEAPSLTHPPLPPPIDAAAACHTSLRQQGASPLTASAASPPTIQASCPRMQTSIPSLPRPCRLTSLARYKCLIHADVNTHGNVVMSHEMLLASHDTKSEQKIDSI